MVRGMLGLMFFAVGCATPSAAPATAPESHASEGVLHVEPEALRALKQRYPQGVAAAVGAPYAQGQRANVVQPALAAPQENLQALKQQLHQQAMNNTGVVLSSAAPAMRGVVQ